MLNATARGVYTIAVTPFLPDGALDLHSLDRVTDFYLEKGADGLTILGSWARRESFPPTSRSPSFAAWWPGRTCR